MSQNTKNLLLAVTSIVAIAGSACWIYFHYFKAPTFNIALNQRVGEVMAEQTAAAVGPKGRILLITIPTSGQAELAAQLDAFNRTLKKLGTYEVKEHELDTKDQPKYGPGTGLSGRRFVRAVKNHSSDAIVSFVGAPDLSDEQIAELTKIPKFIAESRSPDHLPKLFEKKVIHAAVVSRFTFPAPGPLKPSTSREWFDKRYQVVAADNVPAVIKAE